jgi:hypothetical protein
MALREVKSKKDHAILYVFVFAFSFLLITLQPTKKPAAKMHSRTGKC